MMISPSDEDYKKTRLIKKGEAAISRDFQLLAEWIFTTYGTTVLNIIYDTIEPEGRPRLEIIFEYEDDQKLYMNPADYGYNQQLQQEIAAAFAAMTHNYKTNGLWVTFAAFSKIARWEANDNITEESLRQLREKYKGLIWEINRGFGQSLTAFFYTDAELHNPKNDEIKQQIKQECFRLLKQQDEFGYVNVKNCHSSFDSKENFDNNYSSNWYYYYK